MLSGDCSHAMTQCVHQIVLVPSETFPASRQSLYYMYVHSLKDLAIHLLHGIDGVGVGVKISHVRSLGCRPLHGLPTAGDLEHVHVGEAV